MKMLKTIGLCLVLSLVFVACKKDNDPPPFAMEGFWEGKLGNGNTTPDGYFGIKIKPGGVLERYSAAGNLSAMGTWQLNGNNFTGSYKFTLSGTVVTLQGSVDKAKHKVSGNWENDGNEVGLWNASRKN